MRLSTRTAIRRRGAEIAPRKTIVPVFVSQDHGKAEFSAILLQFSDGELAKEANVSKETVKKWKKRWAFPQGRPLLNLAFNNPVVLNWVMAKMGVRQPPEFMTPEFATTAMTLLYRVSLENSPDGDIARDLIRRHSP